MSEEHADNRLFRYIETGDDGTETVVYRASSVGACERALLATARKYERRQHPEWFDAVLDEGRRMEPHIDAIWQNETGVTVVGGQDIVELYVGEIDGRDVIIRGHIDGRIDGDRHTLVEYKKFRPSTWGKFLQQGVEVNVNYPWQVSVYMYAGMFDNVMFVGGLYSPEQDRIVEVAEFRLTNPPIPLAAIRRKVARIERMINAGFDPCDDGVECKASMYPCPYFYLHDDRRDDTTATSTPVDTAVDKPVRKRKQKQDSLPTVTIEPSDALYDLIADTQTHRQEVTRLRRLIEEHDRLAKKAQTDLLAAMTAAGATAGSTATVGDFVLSWTEQHRKAYEVKESTVTEFTITIKE